MQTEDVQAYATEQGLLFNEISAKQDIGVRRTILALLYSVRQLPKAVTPSSSLGSSVLISGTCASFRWLTSSWAWQRLYLKLRRQLIVASLSLAVS